MLDAAAELGVGFRAHVKTHKVWMCFFFLVHLLSLCVFLCIGWGEIGRDWDFEYRSRDGWEMMLLLLEMEG